MVRRHEGTAFMGGAHVFPGGRVDAADHDADDGWCDGIADARSTTVRLKPPFDAALGGPEALEGPDTANAVESAADAVSYHVAAARELFEEAGVLLARNAGGAFVSLAGAD